jgi:hypothetical protein
MYLFYFLCSAFCVLHTFRINAAILGIYRDRGILFTWSWVIPPERIWIRRTTNGGTEVSNIWHTSLPNKLFDIRNDSDSDPLPLPLDLSLSLRGWLDYDFSLSRLPLRNSTRMIYELLWYLFLIYTSISIICTPYAFHWDSGYLLRRGILISPDLSQKTGSGNWEVKSSD